MMPTNSPERRAAVLAQYHGFAVLARAAAVRETLANVRQKHLMSAVSWEQLAANGRKMEGLRDRRMVEELSAMASAKIGIDPAGHLRASLPPSVRTPMG